MATPYVPVWFYLFIMAQIESSSATCDGELSLAGPKMAAMMNRSYPACRAVDIRFSIPICEIGEHDVTDICRTTADTIPCLKSACPDGSWNRTCYPVPRNDVIYAFSCVCHSAAHIWNAADARATYWSDWKALGPLIDGAFYTRNLMMEGGQCIAHEFIKMSFIVAGDELPDSVYTASTSYTGDYLPYKARLTNACAWVYHSTDPDKWLGITLPKQYLIKGCVISRMCSARYVTMVTVSTSDDDVIWRDVIVGEDLSTLYDSYDAAHIWFDESYTSLSWKISMLSSSVGLPRVKADLIGHAL